MWGTTPTTKPAQQSKTQDPKFVAKTTTAQALRFHSPLQHHHQLQHHHLLLGIGVTAKLCDICKDTLSSASEAKGLAWRLLSWWLCQASKPQGSTIPYCLGRGTSSHTSRATMSPPWGGEEGAPPRGPNPPDGFSLTTGSRSHQSSPVAVPVITESTIPSVIASTSTDGILVLPDSRLRWISSTSLWRKYKTSMPTKLRVSLPPPPTSVCSHSSHRIITHLVGTCFLHRMHSCWRSPWRLNSLFMHRMNSITLSRGKVRCSFDAGAYPCGHVATKLGPSFLQCIYPV